MRDHTLSGQDEKCIGTLAASEPPRLVDVCILTYQHAKYIADTLQGVWNQKTTFPFRVIIYDDASTDGAQDIIRTFCQKKPEHISVTLLLQKENLWQKGISGAADLLYPAVTGKYVAMCEGDDYWTDPLKLQKQADYMESHPECTMCFHPGTVHCEDASRPDSIYPPPAEDRIFRKKGFVPPKTMLKRNPATTASCMYRWKYYGEEFKKVFPQNILPGDWFMHLLHAKDGKVGYLPDTMCVYRKHAGGLYSAADNDRAMHYKRFKELENAFFPAAMQLYKERPKEIRILKEQYFRFQMQILRCFLETHDEESFLWFWRTFQQKTIRFIMLTYFTSPPDGLLERIGRIIARMGLREEGIWKTIYRIIWKDPLP